MAERGRFDGKVALASGAGSGIGRAAVEAWLAAGARVTAFDLDGDRLADLAAVLGKEAVATVEGDVSAEDDCQRAVAEALRRFGRVDVVLNAAGTGSLGRVWDMEPAIWDRVLAVNLRGTFLLTRAATRWMVAERRPGRVVNIASTNATVPTTGHAPYCASKAGVVAFTQVAALDLAPHGVTVNAIAPGPVDTALTAPILRLPEARAEFLRHVPVGRIGRPEDIARTILFLADEAADWITGQTFYVDGGQSLVALPPYIDLVERLTGGGL
jgi:NAD(P)-dependent dehydrogenase (short-subunit alcohol dehydrogenase family)